MDKVMMQVDQHKVLQISQDLTFASSFMENFGLLMFLSIVGFGKWAKALEMCFYRIINHMEIIFKSRNHVYIEIGEGG
jgi:hypothetical protein